MVSVTPVYDNKVKQPMVLNSAFAPTADIVLVNIVMWHAALKLSV